MLGIEDADFEETAPTSPSPLISRLSCSLTGAKQTVIITPNTLTFQAYGKDRVTEQFNCNYGLNERYRNDMIQKDLRIVGKDTNGHARIVELASHRFFIATLFLPQLSSNPSNPHPLITAYVNAAIAFRAMFATLSG